MVYDDRHRKGSYAAPTPVTDGTNVYVWFGGEGDGLYSYDLNGKLLWKSGQGHNGTAMDLALSSDGRMIATCGLDGSVKVWDLTRQHGSQRRIIPGPFLTDLAFVPGSRLAAVATRQHKAMTASARPSMVARSEPLGTTSHAAAPSDGGDVARGASMTGAGRCAFSTTDLVPSPREEWGEGEKVVFVRFVAMPQAPCPMPGTRRLYSRRFMPQANSEARQT